MSGLDGEALAGLTAVVESLLPEPPDPSVQFTPLVAPLQISPTGLGGFVGFNQDPDGEIFGRRLNALVLITVQADDPDPVNDALSAVTSALLGTGRADLLEQGILRVALDEIGDQVVTGTGANRVVQRTLSFRILYEFLKDPEEPEEVIQEIPVNLDTKIPEAPDTS